MEAVLYSELPFNLTVDGIELLLSLECRHIWVWIASYALYETLMKEEWEEEVHLFYRKDINSVGDCLRELYIRDETRGNLVIIGDLEKCLQEKFVLQNYGFKKNIGTILFAEGNVGYEMRKGRLIKYGWNDYKSSGYALDIAYCMPIILSIFYDNFDCNTFNDLLLANPVGHSFGVKMDKRITCFTDPPFEEEECDEDFMEELKEMVVNLNLENARLELNSLRMAHGLLFSDLICGLKQLGKKNLIKLMEN